MHFSIHKILLAFALIFYVGFCVPLIPVAADDIRMVDVFSMDEASAVAVVRFLYQTGGWVVEVFSYGGLYYHLPLLFLHGADMVGVEIDDTAIVVFYRGLGTLAGVGCIWLTFLIGRLIAGAIAGVVAAWLLVLTPVFLRWSVEIHPDIPQLLWLLAALYVCCLLIQDRRLLWLVLVGVFAGLAFGTKYAGVFLLPTIGLALFFSFGGEWKALKTKHLWLNYGFILAIFVCVAALTNISAFFHFQTFLSDIEFEREHLSFGHVFQVEKAGLRWLVDLGYLLGIGHGVLVVLVITWLAWARQITNVYLMLFSWVGLFLGYLVVVVNLQAARHLLPVLPILLVFVGIGYAELWRWLNTRLGKPVYAAVGVIFIVSLLSLSQAKSVEALFVTKLHRADERDEILAGRWFDYQYGEDTTLLYHAYGYVPEKFQHAFRVTNMHYLMVNHFEPDVLLVRDAIMNQFDDLADADRAQIGRDAFFDRYYFYEYLKKNLIDTYELKKRFGAVSIYQRVLSKDVNRAHITWAMRMRQWAQREILDARTAFSYMAQRHHAQGQIDEYDRLTTLLKKNRMGDVEAQLLNGRTLLREGQNAAAKAVFDEVVTTIDQAPASNRAAVHLAIGRAYLQTGHMRQAVDQALLALDVNPDYKEARFDLGLFYIAAGELAQAHKSYAIAVERYGQDARALGLLRQFERAGIAVEGTREIMATYFGQEVRP